jgi:hypothetical protein
LVASRLGEWGPEGDRKGVAAGVISVELPRTRPSHPSRMMNAWHPRAILWRTTARTVRGSSYQRQSKVSKVPQSPSSRNLDLVAQGVRKKRKCSPAAFMPAESPPEVNTAIFFCLFLSPDAEVDAPPAALVPGRVSTGASTVSGTPSRSLAPAPAPPAPEPAAPSTRGVMASSCWSATWPG